MTCENCGACTYSNEEYQEFIPYKEYAIGEFFKIGNEVFKVVNVPTSFMCEYCDFNAEDKEWECNVFHCSIDNYGDKITKRMAILYDTLEDNE